MKSSTGVETHQIPTTLGRLHVQCQGTGPTAVLWHSLFVDSTTWHRTRAELSRHRRLVIIDGPSHGKSAPLSRMCTLEECVQSAVDVLDHLGICAQIDWIGNAWGGHLGMLFAALHPERCRTLTAVASPVQALSHAERRKIVPMVYTYRLTGPIRPLARALTDALLGRGTAAAEPESRALVEKAFRGADRTGMYRAMVSVMLNRPSIARYLPNIEAPTVLLVADADPGWTPAQARSAAADMPSGAVRVVRGEGHVAPLVIDPESVTDTIVELWQDPSSTLARLRG